MKKICWTMFLALTITITACASAVTSAPPVSTEASAVPQPDFLASDGMVVASAQVVPILRSQMSFSVSAPVKEVVVKEGDLVKAGQVLLTLYAPDLELAVTSAELALKAADLELIYGSRGWTGLRNVVSRHEQRWRKQGQN